MGTYTDISYIDAPSQAAQGQKVAIKVNVRNKHTGGLYAAVTAAFDGAQPIHLASRPASIAIPAGGLYIFYLDDFVMPNRSLVGEIASWYWGTDSKWHKDDVKTQSISLTVAPPTISASIESLRVYAEGTAPTTPPITVEAGKKLSIRFDAHSGYGSLPSGLYFDASVILKKPSGALEERYDSQATGPYSKCTLSRFIFGEGGLSAGWTADEKGTYYATVILRARTSLIGSNQEVARKSNVKVFTVTQTVPPPTEYKGRIASPQVRWGANNWQPVPKTIEQGQGFSIAFTALNDSSIALVLRGEFEVRWPTAGRTQGGSDFTGTKVPPWEYTVSPGSSWTPKWNPFSQVNAFTADEAGDYTAKFKLYGKKAGEPDSAYKELCTPWEGKILMTTAVGEPPGVGEPGAPISGVYPGEISNLIIRWENLPGRDIPIPVAGSAPVGESAKLAYTCYNRSDRNLDITSECWIRSPGNPNKYHYGPHTPFRPLGYSPGTGPDFIWPSGLPASAFKIDEPGDWTLRITQTTKVDGGEYLMAEYDGPLFAAEEQASMWSLMAEMMPLMMVIMMFSMMIPMTKELGEGVE